MRAELSALAVKCPANAQDQRQEVAIAERRILLTCPLDLDVGPCLIDMGLSFGHSVFHCISQATGTYLENNRISARTFLF